MTSHLIPATSSLHLKKKALTMEIYDVSTVLEFTVA